MNLKTGDIFGNKNVSYQKYLVVGVHSHGCYLLSLFGRSPDVFYWDTVVGVNDIYDWYIL